jgi:hypothetical protein
MRIATMLALVALSLSTTAQAADRKIDEFYGRWLGTGEATQGAAAPVKTQSRDSEVIIERAADGFKISWTTMSSDVSDATKSRVKTAQLTFKPGGKPGYFVEVKSGDALGGKKTTWARVSGDVLTINQLVVADDGQWDVSVYDRSLKDTNTMDLAFTRITNGKIARQASLRMTRAKE